jgi:hypothetical protein
MSSEWFEAHTSVIGHGITTRKTIICTFTITKHQTFTYTSVTLFETKHQEVQELEKERENAALKQ